MHHVSRSFACWTCFPLCGILSSFLSVSVFVSVSHSLFRIRGRLRRQSHRNFCCIFQGAHVAQVITFYRLYKKFLLPLADAVRSKVCAVLRCQVTTKDTYTNIYICVIYTYICAHRKISCEVKETFSQD